MNVCKYCGTGLPQKGHVCGNCSGRMKVIRRFAKVRDELRRKTGLPPMISEGEVSNE